MKRKKRSVVDLSHKDCLPISSSSPFPTFPASGLLPTWVDDQSRSEVEGADGFHGFRCARRCLSDRSCNPSAFSKVQSVDRPRMKRLRLTSRDFFGGSQDTTVGVPPLTSSREAARSMAQSCGKGRSVGVFEISGEEGVPGTAGGCST